jgi:GWxTD domain-containing protein
VKLGEVVSINYKNRKSGIIYVRYYNRDFPIAAPPFSEIPPKPFQYQEDSLFTLNLTPNGTINFVADRKGFYHFQYDSSSHEGCTLFNFTDKFPDIKQAEDMLPPLRYITSKQEFEDLNKAQNKKVAIEKFWLNSTSNPDRAREVIKKYYNRVEDANKYFSSYIEGWKTDRGMIYLIFGRPNIRYVYENYETWIYGEEKSVNALSYTFVKVKNPFTTNDYTLERSPFYKQSWFMSVEAWRQGRANLQE